MKVSKSIQSIQEYVKYPNPRNSPWVPTKVSKVFKKAQGIQSILVHEIAPGSLRKYPKYPKVKYSDPRNSPWEPKKASKKQKVSNKYPN